MKRILRLIRIRVSRLAALAALAGAASPALAQINVQRTNTFSITQDLGWYSGRTLTMNGTLTGSGPIGTTGTLSAGSFSVGVLTTTGSMTVSGAFTVSGASALTTVSATTATLTTATITTANIGTASISTVTVAGTLLAISPSAGIGYGAGSGSASTQLTSKVTAVTLNGLTGQITLNSFSMSSAATASFVMTNSAIVATDVIIPNINSASYSARAFAGTGTALFTITNQSGVTASDSPTVTFIAIRGSSN